MKLKNRNSSLIVWLFFTVVLFVLLLVPLISAQNKEPISSYLVYALITDIGIGIISFLVLVARFANSGDELAYKVKSTKLLNKNKSTSLTKAVLVLTVIFLGFFGYGIVVQNYLGTKQEPNKLNTSQAAPATLGAVDTDPIASCGPGINSKQYVNVRRSECASYTDCQLNDMSWKLIKKTECDTIQRRGASNAVISGPKIDCTGPDGKHMQITQKECDNFNSAWANNKPKQENPPSDQWQNNRINIPNYTNTYVDSSITCYISYPCTGASFTYRMLPSDCTYAQNRATETCNLYPKTTASDLGTGSTFQLSPEVLHAGETITNQSDAWVQDMTNKYGGKPGVTCSSQGICPAPTPAGSWFD